MLKILCGCLMIIYSIANTISTPLDDYVFAPDPHYGYEIIETYNMTGYTVYILNFTSQIWLDGKKARLISNLQLNNIVFRNCLK